MARSGMTIWKVLAEADREQWAYVPSTSVGPLRFGMSLAEATAVLNHFTARVTSVPTYKAVRAEFHRPARPFWFRSAVTAYFAESEGLFCAAVDAQSGPQVVLDGIELVGRAPSHVEAQLIEHAKAHDVELRYQPEGDTEIEDLGLMMRAQRAGDVVLTRPVFAVLGQRAYTIWDAIPGDELDVH